MKIGKQPGDTVHVTMRERNAEKAVPESIDNYIMNYEGEIRTRMEAMRTLIHSCSPNITEKIAWGMPTFVLNGNLVHFSGEKRHMGFHPAPETIEAFRDKLEGYKYSKGTVQFPYDKPMPYGLIREMIEFRVKQNERE